MANSDNAMQIEATRTMREHISALKDLREKIKELEVQEKDFEEKIKKLMGDNDEVTQNGVVVVTWKTVTSKRFDSTAFKAAEPELYAIYTKESSSKRFIVK